MKIFVFLGPTLSVEEARSELEAYYLPPVAQGDVYQVALEQPRAIGIIDGSFEQVPAVWHKEILWAMSQGIHVFGSASMGALRAAELAAFGMEGVGAIFEAFARGELTDDDEVAVSHGPAEDGFRVLSEAMVNIRATLRRAQEEGVLQAATSSRLERIAKELYYPERSYPALLAAATRQGLSSKELTAFRAWLLEGKVPQKRLDALAMLRTLRERLASDPGPKQVRFSFEHTDAWETLRRESARLPSSAQGEQAVMREALLEELRINERYPEEARAALARALALEEARRQNLRHGDEALQRTEVALRHALGVLEPKRFSHWLRENELEDLQRLLRDEASVRWVQEMFAPELERSLPDHLLLTGRYASLLARARDKQRVLREQGLEELGLRGARVTEEELWRWYFETRLRRPVPGDLRGYARDMGFEDARGLEKAALRELLYARAIGASARPEEPGRIP